MSKGFCRIVVVLLVLTTVLSGASVAFAAQDAQNIDVIAPESLNRLSWGAVIAGSVIALIIQLALNLLGISIGVSTINPQYGEDSAEPKALATGAAVWIGVSTLLALFAGGWLAARFAGLPNDVDGLLHGIMVWGVVMLISIFLLLTSIGRIISGTTSLINQGLTLAGHAAQAASQGVANVARGVAGAAQTAASTAGQAAQNAVNSAENAARQNNVGDPMQRIQAEVRKMMEQAGVPADRVQATAEGAVDEARNTAQQIVRNPGEAERLINDALGRVLNNAQDVVSDVDRDSVIDVMTANTNLSREQARQALSRWEQTYRQAGQQAEQVRDQVSGKVQEVRVQAEQKVEQIRHDVDRTARDAAQAVTDAIARAAGIAFAAIVIGAIAAGLGGLLGAPEEVPIIVEEVGQLPTQP
jgi:F0F1-type ATP synthase membrane subunit b/b'